jgi:hypothetical protein
MKLTQQQKILSVLQSLQSGDHHIPEGFTKNSKPVVPLAIAFCFCRTRV